MHTSTIYPNIWDALIALRILLGSTLMLYVGFEPVVQYSDVITPSRRKLSSLLLTYNSWIDSWVWKVSFWKALNWMLIKREQVECYIPNFLKGCEITCICLAHIQIFQSCFCFQVVFSDAHTYLIFASDMKY